MARTAASLSFHRPFTIPAIPTPFGVAISMAPRVLSGLPFPPPLQRAKLFKAGVGRDEARRGRSETQVQIRKEKKEERLNQRRRKGSAGDALGGFSFATIPESGAPAAGTGAAAVDTPAHMRVSSLMKFVRGVFRGSYLVRGVTPVVFQCLRARSRGVVGESGYWHVLLVTIW